MCLGALSNAYNCLTAFVAENCLNTDTYFRTKLKNHIPPTIPAAYETDVEIDDECVNIINTALRISSEVSDKYDISIYGNDRLY